jgi:hypothetical protein
MYNMRYGILVLTFLGFAPFLHAMDPKDLIVSNGKPTEGSEEEGQFYNRRRRDDFEFFMEFTKEEIDVVREKLSQKNLINTQLEEPDELTKKLIEAFEKFDLAELFLNMTPLIKNTNPQLAAVSKKCLDLSNRRSKEIKEDLENFDKPSLKKLLKRGKKIEK